MSKWLTIQNGEWIIVVPESDILPHGFPEGGHMAELAGVSCPCKPKLNWQKRIIIHNSFHDIEKIKSSIKKHFK